MERAPEDVVKRTAGVSVTGGTDVLPSISIVIPTFQREDVLVQTINRILTLVGTQDEIIVVDQTAQHDDATERELSNLESSGQLTWIRRREPTITGAMNHGLLAASKDVVLFLDDDTIAESALLATHRMAHSLGGAVLVAGRVIQPWEEQLSDSELKPGSFAGTKACWLDAFIGANFSVRRVEALAIGGFDENFVEVAYRYEAEFASRFESAGGRIRFEPAACVHHLHLSRGGTRSYGQHLTTSRPAHAVGAYYHALRTAPSRSRVRRFSMRVIKAIATRHHLRRPWWIPITLIAEIRGMLWAWRLHRSGPKLIETESHAH